MHDPIAALAAQFQQEWWRDALCVGMDPNIWFPLKGKTAREAKAICADCPAQEACLDYALESPQQKYGVWGGMTERERRKESRRRRGAA